MFVKNWKIFVIPVPVQPFPIFLLAGLQSWTTAHGRTVLCWRCETWSADYRAVNHQVYMRISKMLSVRLWKRFALWKSLRKGSTISLLMSLQKRIRTAERIVISKERKANKKKWRNYRRCWRQSEKPERRPADMQCRCWRARFVGK